MTVTDAQLALWAEQAKRDDWHMNFVGSNIRQLIGEVQRARSKSGTPKLQYRHQGSASK